MGEIDLIPASYRKRRQFLRWLKGAAGTLLGVTALVVGLFVLLRIETGKLDGELRQLQLQKAITSQQRADLESLNARKRDLTQQHDLLSGLRSGAAAEQMFATVDRAMAAGDVWFTDWNFRRAGTATGMDPETVHAGYFIVVSNDKQASKEAWMIQTQMKIDGEALDHAALSQFVSNLIDQPEIQSVRVVRTETVLVSNRPLVRFSLDVVVAAEQAEARS